MKKVFSVLGLLAVLLLLPTCKKQNPEQEKVDVQFEVPATMTIEDGASEISFRVQFAKPPVSGDQVVLGSGSSEFVCPVTSVSDTRFSASISGVWSKGFGPGTYTVYHQRGSTKNKKGTMDVIVKYAGDEEVEPAAGSTVYGKVSCEGTGLAGVVVSDGVEVVKTDSKGVYQMKSKKYHGYVFVSTPSGYEPLTNGILPRFHAPLKANASTAELVNFQLKKVEGQDNHRMLMLGDIHLAARTQATDDRNQFKAFVEDINETIEATPGNVYAMTLGDMTWDPTSTRSRTTRRTSAPPIILSTSARSIMWSWTTWSAPTARSIPTGRMARTCAPTAVTSSRTNWLGSGRTSRPSRTARRSS